jgi:hypothetical protein
MDVMVFHMPSGHIQIEVVTEAALAEIVTVASKGQWNAKTLPSPIYIPVGNKRCPGRDGINPNGTFHTHVWTPKRAWRIRMVEEREKKKQVVWVRVLQRGT